jgi:hypothetical protein
MIAVLMPTTRARVSTSGPPEFPGLSATSLWMMSSMRRPVALLSERPIALTTPADTVDWKPNGLPIATTSCPTRSDADSPNRAVGSPEPSARITARSVAGSLPASVAPSVEPSVSVTSRSVAAFTMWLFVTMYPSGVKITPEPAPIAPADRPGRLLPAAMPTTAGPTRSATETTARE